MNVWWDSTGKVYEVNLSTYALTVFDTNASSYDFLIASNGYTYRIYDNGSGKFIQRRLSSGGAFSTVITGSVFVKMCEAPNGNIYAVAKNGDIYVQYSGVGSFVPLGQTFRDWSSICAASNGNIYASVLNGDIYVQYSGVGSFVPLGQTFRSWGSITEDYNNNIYIAPSTDIYYIDNAAKGTANLDGGTLKQIAGTGKGTGSSNYEVYTGQKTTSGTDMQIETLRIKIDNEGKSTFYGIINLKGYTVSTLPTGVVGDTAYVTDATSPTFLSTVVGGGSVKCRVFFNGTNWVLATDGTTLAS